MSHEHRHDNCEAAKCYALCMFGDAMAWLAVYLRKQSGGVSPESEVILNQLLDRSARIARAVTKLDNQTQPPERAKE